MINAKTTDIPVPVTRTEHFMYSAITGNESGLKADTQAEMYLDAIKNGDTSDLEGLEPRTVLDMYLEARQTGVVDDLPKPRTTSEMLLYQAITGEDLGAKPVSNVDKYLSLLEPNNYDARLEIESENSTIKLTDSKDGVVEVKELEGNTLVNIAPKPSKVAGDGNINDRVVISDNVVELTLESGFYTGINFTQDSRLIKPNTTYTIIANVIENTMTQGGFVIIEANDNTIFNSVPLPLGHKGIYVTTTTTRSSYTLPRIQSMSSTTCKTGEKIKFSLMVLEGDFTNKPIPAEYFEGMKSVGECEDNKLEIVSQNKNLFDVNKIQIENGSLYGYMYLGGSDKYTISITDKDTSVDMSEVYFGFTGNGKDASNDVRWVMGKGEVIKTQLTSYGNLKYFSFHPNNQETLNKITSRFNIQIEEGSVATSYAPHTTNTKEITLSEPLRGLPNEVRDRIVVKDGKLMIERNYGEVLLNGSEDWKLANTYTGAYKFAHWVSTLPKAMSRSNSKDQLSDRLIISNAYMEIKNSVWIYGTQVRLFLDGSQTTIEEFKQWLQENPTKVVYQLAEPTYEEITPELRRLILKCYDNATLHFNTNIPPKSLISYTANTSNIYKYLDTLKLSKEECDSIINSMERV